MPRPRKPVPGKGELHLITCATFRQQDKLGIEKHRGLLCQLLEQLRAKYRFQIVGYVVMPTHLLVLMSGSEMETVENIILALRQRYQRRYNTSVRLDEPAWEKKFIDKHVVGSEQIQGCLSLMHEAPVKARLAEKTTDWEWGSARRYAGLPEGVVTVDPVKDPRVVGLAISH
jgi:putative transposase